MQKKFVVLDKGETVKEFDSIIKPDIGRIVFLGTPQTEMSLYNELEDRGFKTQIWPSRYPDQKGIVQYGHKLATSLIENIKKLISSNQNESALEALVIFEKSIENYGKEIIMKMANLTVLLEKFILWEVITMLDGLKIICGMVV